MKPIPPSVCTQSLPLRNAASNASAAAAAIASPAPLSRSFAARASPHRRARELGARQHVGAAVLHALELADRPAELHAHLRVLGRRVDTPLRDPDRLRREQHRREVAHALRGETRQPAIGGHGHAFEVELGDAPGEVEARQLGDARGGRVERGPLAVDLAHDHVGVVAAEHRPGAAERDGARALAGRQLRQPVAAAGPGRLQDRRGQHRREIRARRARATELLDHDRLLDEAVPGAAVRFRDVQPEPARFTESRPRNSGAGRLGRRRPPAAPTGMFVSTKRRTA